MKDKNLETGGIEINDYEFNDDNIYYHLTLKIPLKKYKKMEKVVKDINHTQYKSVRAYFEDIIKNLTSDI